ncbi:MAG TPA: N-formylglutamate deformylase [Polyangiales bacterium]
MNAELPEWLTIRRGAAPLLVSFPHTGTDLPGELVQGFVSPWLARKDADHWVHLLYDFVHELGATSVRTAISRSVIDVNRDPSGMSLYPGQTTTELCPTATFDGEALYRAGHEPDESEIARRRERYFAPYHAALSRELERLLALHGVVVLYDAHSIRSFAPRLFAGALPELNLGNYDGKSCGVALLEQAEKLCAGSRFSCISNGRFKGGYITRHYGRPQRGVHALQMELAMRAYLHEPDAAPTPDNWPPPYDPAQAAALRAALRSILEFCLAFASAEAGRPR